MSLSTVPYALAVDDDPFILMDVTGILEDAGFRTYEADHGDAAIAMLPEYAHTITLLFSDVHMGSRHESEFCVRQERTERVRKPVTR